jgi:hypothetical protein
MQQGRFRCDGMIHHPGAVPNIYVPILIPRGVDWFCLACMGRFWKAPKRLGRYVRFRPAVIQQFLIGAEVVL